MRHCVLAKAHFSPAEQRKHPAAFLLIYSGSTVASSVEPEGFWHGWRLGCTDKCLLISQRIFPLPTCNNPESLRIGLPHCKLWCQRQMPGKEGSSLCWPRVASKFQPGCYQQSSILEEWNTRRESLDRPHCVSCSRSTLLKKHSPSFLSVCFCRAASTFQFVFRNCRWPFW